SGAHEAPCQVPPRHVRPRVRRGKAENSRKSCMAETYDLILAGGTVVNQDGAGARDIGVRGGRIAALGKIAKSAAAERTECKGLHILPAVIDTQVRFREPGARHKEDLETSSRAAVQGGVTAVFE